MKWYPVVSGGRDQADALKRAEFGRALLSFAAGGRDQFMKEMPTYDLLIDSGAFSVWSIGETIDLDGYIAWSQAATATHQGPIRIINLDVIPGKRGGGSPSARERVRAAREGMDNADRIRAAGLDVMEVFHRHEPLDILDELLDRRRPGEVLGIGGLVAGGGVSEKRMVCDSIFSRLRDRAGGWQGIAPMHGLGVSPTSPLGRRYPWWSCDASSWVFARKFGKRPGKFKAWGQDDKRTTVTPVAERYFAEALTNWRRLEETYTRLWADRGVTYDLEEAIA